LGNNPIATVSVRAVCLSCAHTVLTRSEEAAARAIVAHTEFVHQRGRAGAPAAIRDDH
jgi:hypothetical protein